MKRDVLEVLRARIFAALAHGDEEKAQNGIAELQAYEPAEAAGLRTALHIEAGRAGEAFAAWQQRAALAPDDPYTIFLRARIHVMENERICALTLLVPLLQQRLPAAVAEKAYNLAGQCARFLGRAAEAVHYYAQARDAAEELSLRALNASNVLFNRHYLPASLAEDRRAAEEYGALFADVRPFTHEKHNRSGERRLRIGYLSPDVREHVVLSFSHALMTALDPARFEVFVYAMNRADSFTEKVRNAVDVFRNLSQLSAEEAARSIYRDGIDILVDLAGHTAGRTLPILAYRPAPVQISGIGYFASTGLPTVDYFLADPVLAAGNVAEGFTEKLLVLPHSHFCWQPLHPAPVPVHAPAAGRSIVFGSFNNFTKLNDRVLSVWAEILRRVPESRLLLKTDVFSYADSRREALRRIEAAGIPLVRVDAEGASADYLAAYARVDIALDPFPYPGGGTTCDALYMGVPVVTLTGESLGSRFGASLLENIGAKELAAHTEEDYIALAVSLAQDAAALDALHAGLRAMMETSPVMDAAGYGRDLGAAYARVWAEYADAARLKSAPVRDDRISGDIQEIRARIFAALEAGQCAEAQECAEAAFAAGVQDDMLCYLHAYAVERQGDLPRAMALAEAYLAAQRTPLRHAFMRLRAAVAYRMGDVRAAEFYRSAYEEEPSDPSLYSSFLLAQNAQEADMDELFRAHCAYEKIFKDVPRCAKREPYRHKKIRVGYISPDFRRNVMLHFIQPMLTMYDRAHFDVYAYSLTAQPDEATAALRPHAAAWRDLGGAAPEEIAACIQEDEIDILVELAGHAAGGALPVLARRPAPVQMTGLGYTATSGLRAVDYFLTDAVCDPVGGTSERYFTEKLIRLPSQFVYVPRAGLPAAAETPARSRGYITFGVFNQYRKYTDAMLTVWREIMERVPTARLLIKSQVFFSSAMTETARARMKRLGFDLRRVALEPATTDYMQRYLDVDIALDTYPWPGGGTTCDALYMGVPVVTMYGARRSTRFSYALLAHIGRTDLAVQTPADYIERAVSLAGDLAALDALHRGLRGRMETSPVMDQEGYMRALEQAYHSVSDRTEGKRQ